MSCKFTIYSGLCTCQVGLVYTPPEADGVLTWSHNYSFQFAADYSWSDDVAEIPWDS